MTIISPILHLKSLHIICFGCLFLYNIHINLPNPRSNNSFSCLYDDHIRPIDYLVYTHKAIHSLVFGIAGLRTNQFITLQAYTAWLLVQEPNKDALLNILEIIIANMNIKIIGALPGGSISSTPREILIFLQMSYLGFKFFLDS